MGQIVEGGPAPAGRWWRGRTAQVVVFLLLSPVVCALPGVMAWSALGHEWTPRDSILAGQGLGALCALGLLGWLVGGWVEAFRRRAGAKRAGAAVAGGDLLRTFLADRDAACPGCGYSLRGAATDRCPECGRTLRLALEGARRLPPFGVPVAVALLAVAGWLGVSLWRSMDVLAQLRARPWIGRMGWPHNVLIYATPALAAAGLLCVLGLVALWRVWAWRDAELALVRVVRWGAWLLVLLAMGLGTLDALLFL